MSKTQDELREIEALLRNNTELLKPNFGFMFWQLADIEKQYTPEEFIEQGMNLELQQADDEIVAEFLGIYFKLWRDSKDLSAASRFIASRLGMSADELLQMRIVYMSK
ncbi:hypothetical protein N9D31_01215 [Oligoflexaceae bacterium]|nr:hypothetical protein [Oligoflexaceae bacterium]